MEDTLDPDSDNRPLQYYGLALRSSIHMTPSTPTVPADSCYCASVGRAALPVTGYSCHNASASRHRQFRRFCKPSSLCLSFAVPVQHLACRAKLPRITAFVNSLSWKVVSDKQSCRCRGTSSSTVKSTIYPERVVLFRGRACLCSWYFRGKPREASSLNPRPYSGALSGPCTITTVRPSSTS